MNKEPNYEFHKNVLTNFLPEIKRYEPVVISHSSMDAWKKCNRLFLLSVIMGFRSRGKSPVFGWGIAYHLFREGLEKYYGFGVDTPNNYDSEKAREAFIKAATQATKYFMLNVGDQPVGTMFEYMTMARFQESMKFAFDRWKIEKQTGRINVVAVEQLLTVEVVPGIYTSARIDQLVEVGTRSWGKDFKTTKKSLDFYENGVTPNDQFTRQTYIESKLTGKVDGVLVDVLFNSKDTKTRKNGPEIRVFPASRTDYDLRDWEKDELMQREFMQISREKDHYPKNETYCRYCQFRTVCSRASDNAQLTELKSKFEISHFDNSQSDFMEE